MSLPVTSGTPSDIQRFLLIYKIPLLFLGVGTILLAASVGVIFSYKKETPEVVFQTQQSATDAAVLKVDVSGAVNHPGVYDLKINSRVNDAIQAAGGLKKDADTVWIGKHVNKAAKLVDGGKLYIPPVQDHPSGSGQIAGEQEVSDEGVPVVNINTGTQSQLESLPGVGEVTAKKIVSGRPYQTIEELRAKKIIGPSLYEKIHDLLSL